MLPAVYLFKMLHYPFSIFTLIVVFMVKFNEGNFWVVGKVSINQSQP